VPGGFLKTGKMNSVEINGKKYPVKFGLSSVKKFALKKGLKTLPEFEKWLEKLNDGSFEGVEGIGDLLFIGIERGCAKHGVDCDIDADDIIDLTMEDSEAFNQIMEIFQVSISVEGDPSKNLKTLGNKPRATKKK